MTSPSRRATSRVGLAAAVPFLTAAVLAETPPPPYKDPHLAIDRRVADILSRLSIEDKVAELVPGRRQTGGVVDPTGQFTAANYGEALQDLFRPA